MFFLHKQHTRTTNQHNNAMSDLGIDGVFKLTDELLQHELSQRHLPTDGERSDMQVSQPSAFWFH